MGFWDNVKARRIRKNYSQEDMANKLSFKLGTNMIQTGYSYYEGKRAKKVPEELMEAIAEILETTVEELAGKNEINLDHFPKEIRTWLGNPESVQYVMKSYFEYLQSQVK